MDRPHDVVHRGKMVAVTVKATVKSGRYPGTFELLGVEV
jgi:hypothetical protein